MEILATNTNKPAVVTPGSNVQRNAAPAPVSADAQPVVKPTIPAPSATYQLEQVQRAIEQLKQSIKPALANSLEFDIDQSTGKTVIKIMDVETSRLIRQIPSEEMLIIAEALDRMQGRGGLVKQQA
jgi:flagellar protein FlaG